MLKKFTIYVYSILLFASANLTSDVSAQTVKADYRFENSRGSTTAGAPDLTDIGAGANVFATATVDGMARTVLQFPEANGLRLAPMTGVVPNGVYTIVVLFEFDTMTGYRRIVDFKNGTSDSGLYILNGVLTFFPGVTGATTLVPNTFYQAVLTRDAAGTVTGYVDGNFQFTFNDAGGQSAVIDTNNVLRFFRDNESGGGGGEQSGGSASRIRLFDGALTAAEVAALDRTPAAPTAATVTVGGRATSATGRGIRNVSIQMTDANGSVRTAVTSAFGYYQFANVATGETYIFTARGKAYSFSEPTRLVNIGATETEVNFVAYPSDRVK